MMDSDVMFPEIPANRGDDLHNIEHLHDADLVLFMAGNQFMVMEELLAAFQDAHPMVKKIFYETLPPGLELQQILAGGARFRDLEITVTPDVYTSVSEEAMQELMTRGLISAYTVYLHNRIVLMVRKGNPSSISAVTDLGSDEVRISQPSAMEDISHYIIDMYEKAGGHDLVTRIVEEKRAEGTTVLTVVHHRETPLRLAKGTVDVGPVWATEVFNAIREGREIAAIEPGEALDQRERVNYFIAKLKDAPNPGNADRFLEFIRSGQAQDIYRRYGFVPHVPGAPRAKSPGTA